MVLFDLSLTLFPFIQVLLEETGSKLGHVTDDRNKYKSVLDGLITQVHSFHVHGAFEKLITIVRQDTTPWKGRHLGRCFIAFLFIVYIYIVLGYFI